MWAGPTFFDFKEFKKWYSYRQAIIIEHIKGCNGNVQVAKINVGPDDSETMYRKQM